MVSLCWRLCCPKANYKAFDNKQWFTAYIHDLEQHFVQFRAVRPRRSVIAAHAIGSAPQS